MSGIKYTFSGLVKDHEKIRDISDEIRKDASEDDRALLDAVESFSEDVFGNVFANDQEGSFSIEVTGGAKHDGATVQVTIGVRRVVLPSQNALAGSASALPLSPEEEARKKERISRTRTNQDAPLPAARPNAAEVEAQGRHS